MVSAQLFAEICVRINEGRSIDTVGTDTLFGKINIICLGDMGQLRPVKADSLFAHCLVENISPNVKENCTGIDALYGAWIWRQFQKVVILRHNFRAEKDPEFTNLLARIRLGLAWDGRSPMTKDQVGTGCNYIQSDYKTIHGRQLQAMSVSEQQEFADAPIICGTKVVRDAINRELTRDFARCTGTAVHDYYAQDFFNSLPLNESLQQRTWQVRSSITKDSLGQVPLVVGMKVMLTENIALKAGMVNGRRYADCVYIEIPDSNVDLHPAGVNDGLKFNISRLQLPLLPAYAYTDFKSQGRSLDLVIVDLEGARSLQGLYVMLSRATTLKMLAVLRNFGPRTMSSRLAEEFRDEFRRLERLDAETTKSWMAYKAQQMEVDVAQY
ncbi:P-loop containing nucleoside triphosphate hydrolase protein [Mycena rebaudengoi]|nr:P-loop containing nucleoside triphosphate hydrolase protein [Mycena rebaudengoi]